MLKIKDNVDLKELEKFGFKPYYDLVSNDTGESYLKYYYQTKRYSGKYGFCQLLPIKKRITKYKSCIITNRYIENHLKYSSLKISDRDFIDLDTIYDLIQADLVEKVGDE